MKVTTVNPFLATGTERVEDYQESLLADHWYFYDETGNYYGPFITEKEAVEALDHYIEVVLG